MLQWWYGALRCDNSSVLKSLIAHSKQAAREAASKSRQQADANKKVSEATARAHKAAADAEDATRLKFSAAEIQLYSKVWKFYGMALLSLEEIKELRDLEERGLTFGFGRNYDDNYLTLFEVVLENLFISIELLYHYNVLDDQSATAAY